MGNVNMAEDQVYAGGPVVGLTGVRHVHDVLRVYLFTCPSHQNMARPCPRGTQSVVEVGGVGT